MVFTIEPSFYFRDEDLSVPAEFCGMGVRIEDDIPVTAQGSVNLSSALPRNSDQVEQWVSASAVNARIKEFLV
jgi:Xaa-Pro aminopeptidase